MNSQYREHRTLNFSQKGLCKLYSNQSKWQNKEKKKHKWHTETDIADTNGAWASSDRSPQCQNSWSGGSHHLRRSQFKHQSSSYWQTLIRGTSRDRRLWKIYSMSRSGDWHGNFTQNLMGGQGRDTWKSVTWHLQVIQNFGLFLNDYLKKNE